MRQALLGVDVGTTNIKAAAFTPDGKEVGNATQATPTLKPSPGRVEYDVEVLWQQVCSLLRSLITSLPDDVESVAIAFTGMAEAGVALDQHGNVLSHAISWLDTRTVDELSAWEAVIGKEQTATITGLPLSTAAGILRLLWLRTHEPDTFEQTDRWLNLPDYCAYRLCGVAATDHSLGSRMMLLDLATKQWSDSICRAVDVAPAMFGEAVPSGIALGTVTEQASELTGLRSGLPVVSGGHDHICAALALGLTESGDVLDSIGTAEAMLVTLDQPHVDADIAAQGIAQGLHVVADRYYAMSGLYYAGGSIEWLRSVLNVSGSSAGYAQLLESAEEISPASDDPLFLAHLRQANPPLFDPLARAAFIGLTADHGAGHMARAVIEGIACEYHRLFEAVVDAFAIDPERVIATGGGTRNRVLMQIKSALLGRPVEIPEVDEAAALGAAMLAGLGSNAYTDIGDARSRIVHSSTTVDADNNLCALHEYRYRNIYVSLYDALKPVNKTIAGE